MSEMDKICVVSISELNSLVRIGVNVEGKSEIVHNGVDVRGVREVSSVHSNLKGNFKILFPGGAKWSKGGDLLVEALHAVRNGMPDFHLYIALDVPQGSALREMVKGLGLSESITFTGFLSRNDYLMLLNSVDLFVLPSRREGLPISVLEAMALGKPLVVSDAGGISEVVVDGRNGKVVAAERREIAEALYSIYRNPIMRAEMSTNNKQDGMAYDWSNAVSRYLSVYQELTKSIDLVST